MASSVEGMLAPSPTAKHAVGDQRLGALGVQLVLGGAGQGDVALDGPDALAALMILGAGHAGRVFLDAAALALP